MRCNWRRSPWPIQRKESIGPKSPGGRKMFETASALEAPQGTRSGGAADAYFADSGEGRTDAPGTLRTAPRERDCLFA